jgi:hypothetical protein
VLIDEVNKTKLLASGGLDAPLASTSEPTESMLPFADVDLLTDRSKSDDGEDSDSDRCDAQTWLGSRNTP